MLVGQREREAHAAFFVRFLGVSRSRQDAEVWSNPEHYCILYCRVPVLVVVPGSNNKKANQSTGIVLHVSSPTTVVAKCFIVSTLAYFSGTL